MTKIPGYEITPIPPDVHRPDHLWIEKLEGECGGDIMSIGREKFEALKIETVEQMDEFWQREF